MAFVLAHAHVAASSVAAMYRATRPPDLQTGLPAYMTQRFSHSSLAPFLATAAANSSQFRSAARLVSSPELALQLMIRPRRLATSGRDVKTWHRMGLNAPEATVSAAGHNLSTDKLDGEHARRP